MSISKHIWPHFRDLLSTPDGQGDIAPPSEAFRAVAGRVSMCVELRERCVTTHPQSPGSTS